MLLPFSVRIKEVERATGGNGKEREMDGDLDVWTIYARRLGKSLSSASSLMAALHKKQRDMRACASRCQYAHKRFAVERAVESGGL